jgi:uncharacterized membrane protein
MENNIKSDSIGPQGGSQELISSQPGILDKQSNPQPTTGFWAWFWRSFNPFRRATFRGIGIVLPPLLTIIIFFWVWNTLDRAILSPVESMAQHAILYFVDQTKTNEEVKKLVANGQGKIELQDGQRFLTGTLEAPFVEVGAHWIPVSVFEAVQSNPGKEPPATSQDFNLRYIQLKYLKRHLVIPAFLAMFIALLYLLGKLLAIGLGRLLHDYFENLINRLPIIRNVYSSVKQVTDFAFSEKQEVQFSRVIALEYPRPGMWALAFVTGEGMAELRDITGEPMITALVPTSPMPATGFSIMVAKSQTIDVDVSIDQAIQYCMSCGVVIPEHQNPKKVVEGFFSKKAIKKHEPLAS